MVTYFFIFYDLFVFIYDLLHLLFLIIFGLISFIKVASGVRAATARKWL